MVFGWLECLDNVPGDIFHCLGGHLWLTDCDHLRVLEHHVSLHPTCLDRLGALHDETLTKQGGP